MKYTIALAGNPNCGKTTLFNELTGARQFVGNWPGVTVEKKEGKLKGNDDITIIDLPGIYSLSPYSPEEKIARHVLLEERPDMILNIIDGSNLERNLYLTLQLLETGIPCVIAVNMCDVLAKRKNRLDVEKMSHMLGCPVIEISALKEVGITEMIAVVKKRLTEHAMQSHATYDSELESLLKAIEQQLDDGKQNARWYAVKLVEHDEETVKTCKVTQDIQDRITVYETKHDDTGESLIAEARYMCIERISQACLHHSNREQMTFSDRLDRILTNRILALPIFAVVMFLVYFIAMAGPGQKMTDWVNDGVFGDGWHLFGIGSTAYHEAADSYQEAVQLVDGYHIYVEEHGVASDTFTYEVVDEETLQVHIENGTKQDVIKAEETLKAAPDGIDPSQYGIYIPSIPQIAADAFESWHVALWVEGLVVDGVIAGIGAVLGFLPQMLVLFFLLALLEGSGYMARIAFILDRIFRRFGLSGKSFIPMLVATGCGIPGIMASRTIEDERDRRMTIVTTTFMPCGAKIPFIAMIAGALFHNSPLTAVSAYFLGMAAVVVSGIMLKKTKMFAGEAAPFVMEMPPYHVPSLKNACHVMWERGSGFAKKAGTVILLASIIIWGLTHIGINEQGFLLLEEEEISQSLLAVLVRPIAFLFTPLGWGDWRAAAASIAGLTAKENIVSTIGILYPEGINTAFSQAAGYSFLVFNLLCAPCFAAIGAIKKEMADRKMTWFAIGYQTVFAYSIALMIYGFSTRQGISLIFAIIIALMLIYGMVRKPAK